MNKIKILLALTLTGVLLSVMSSALQGCSRSRIIDVELERSVIDFREWMRMPGHRRNLLLDALRNQYLAYPSERTELYEEATNMMANTVLFSTNGLARWSWKHGILQSPYVQPVQSYLHLVEEVIGRVAPGGRYEAFCFRLEVWRRLNAELACCDMGIDQWVMLCDEEGAERLGETFKRHARECILGEMRYVERKLETFYTKESDESRRAYELFRQVIGRDADPPYRSRARERVERQRARDLP